MVLSIPLLAVVLSGLEKLECGPVNLFKSGAEKKTWGHGTVGILWLAEKSG